MPRPDRRSILALGFSVVIVLGVTLLHFVPDPESTVNIFQTQMLASVDYYPNASNRINARFKPPSIVLQELFTRSKSNKSDTKIAKVEALPTAFPPKLQFESPILKRIAPAVKNQDVHKSKTPRTQKLNLRTPRLPLQSESQSSPVIGQIEVTLAPNPAPYPSSLMSSPDKYWHKNENKTDHKQSPIHASVMKPPAKTPSSLVPDWAVQYFSENPTQHLHRKAMDESCDLFNGRWVYDESYPLWDPRLKMPTNDFLCLQHGRNDASYMKLRWQPSQCNMPRFNARFILEKMRNRRIAFVGDSLAKNQFFSLAGMLTNSTRPELIKHGGRELYENKRKVLFGFKFIEFNLSLELYTSGYLVKEIREPKDLAGKVDYLLDLDNIGDEFNSIIDGVDLAIFNSGHWFTERKLKGRKRFPKVNGVIDYKMAPQFLFKTAIQRWSKWLDTKWDKDKTFFFRSFEPVHGKGTKPRVCPVKVPTFSEERPPFAARVRTVREVLKRAKHPPLFLDITEMSGLRNDAHTHVDSHRGDCSHWCTPGVPDTWNEVMFAMMMQQRRPPFSDFNPE